MHITAIKPFIVDGGFRPWTFIKVETSDLVLVGWGDCTDWGSPGPVVATVERYAEMGDRVIPCRSRPSGGIWRAGLRRATPAVLPGKPCLGSTQPCGTSGGKAFQVCPCLAVIGRQNALLVASLLVALWHWCADGGQKG